MFPYPFILRTLPIEIPIVDHLIMQYTKEKYLISLYDQFSESLIEHEQHQ